MDTNGDQYWNKANRPPGVDGFLLKKMSKSSSLKKCFYILICSGMIYETGKMKLGLRYISSKYRKPANF